MDVEVAVGVADGDGERSSGDWVVIRIGREGEVSVGIDVDVTVGRRGGGVGQVGAVRIDGDVTLPVIVPLAAMLELESYVKVGVLLTKTRSNSRRTSSRAPISVVGEAGATGVSVVVASAPIPKGASRRLMMPGVWSSRRGRSDHWRSV